MNNLTLIAVLLGLMAVAYHLGLRKSRGAAGDKITNLHSRPVYYGALVALWCGLPAFFVFILWTGLEPAVIRNVVMSSLPPELAGLSPEQANVLLSRLQNIVSGFGVSDATPAEMAAAKHLAQLKSVAQLAKITVLVLIAIGGLLYARARIVPTLRARNQVERVINAALALCSGIAILTTIGIVFSMLGEAIHFFSFVKPVDFFFGTTWNPGFSSTGQASVGDYGLLPLLWGTLMVSFIALLVAVPIGLMTAIYLAEYAPGWFRSFAKPVIEVLAGIPTIVYGVFALMVVGPFFAQMGELVGLQIRATSAITAGFVMGVMIIPFVSSLSDDIITQVPGAMRDGSLGLGATKSETIRQVILPAALPGIVGAFLLAASRAIGETMIVVLAAGNSPLLHANPLDAVSTVTVTIVNQLTGDTDFASPQSLVAFALGLTLFTITLGLNVIALYIVRKYREQYE